MWVQDMLDADFVKIAKALADPTRRQMIARLRELGSMNCSQVVENFPLSQPTISHHIKTLESAGLVSVRRDGQFHILSLEEARLAEFAAQVLPQSAASKPRRSSETRP